MMGLTLGILCLLWGLGLVGHSPTFVFGRKVGYHVPRFCIHLIAYICDNSPYLLSNGYKSRYCIWLIRTPVSQFILKIKDSNYLSHVFYHLKIYTSL